MLILKNKSLTSENLFKRETREVYDMSMDLLLCFNDTIINHLIEKQTLRSMLDLIILKSDQVHASHRQAESSIDDFRIYIKALEWSHKSVDGNFDKTVAQPAEREADEKGRVTGKSQSHRRIQ